MIAAMSRRARGVAVLAVVLASVVEARPVGAQPACTPVVRVVGEPARVDPVIALLRRRGVALEGESECGTLTAVLTEAGERTRITIVDADGRTVERVAGDVEAAATAIESWARGDLSAPLLAAREPPPVAAARQAPDREEPPPIQQAVIETRPIEIGASAGAGLSSDRALWTAAQAHGCVAVGPTCIGARVRYAIDTESQGESVLLLTSRRTLDLLLTGDLPLRFGRLALTPGVGIGQTALRARRGSGERERVTTTGLLLHGRASAGVRVTGAWSLQADLAVGAAPFARRILQEEQFGPEDSDDPDDGLDMAGVPRLIGWFGLGLTYGGL
jgi:hypothetical protein